MKIAIAIPAALLAAALLAEKTPAPPVKPGAPLSAAHCCAAPADCCAVPAATVAPVTLTIAVSAKTEPGAYPVTIVARGAKGEVEKTTLLLTVFPAAAAPEPKK